jgi:hypothetical protein
VSVSLADLTGSPKLVCSSCGKEVDLVIHDTPGGFVVSSVCHACATVRVPVTGPEADEALRRWRKSRGPKRQAMA